jgi:hypothetical protein
MGEIDVNWSKYIRDCLQEKVDQHKMKAASDKLDEVRERRKPTSTEEILAWIREDGKDRLSMYIVVLHIKDYL